MEFRSDSGFINDGGALVSYYCDQKTTLRLQQQGQTDSGHSDANPKGKPRSKGSSLNSRHWPLHDVIFLRRSIKMAAEHARSGGRWTEAPLSEESVLPRDKVVRHKRKCDRPITARIGVQVGG